MWESEVSKRLWALDVENDTLSGFKGIDERAINGGTWNKGKLGYLA